MGYFEDLASDLDLARPVGTLSTFVKERVTFESLPFDLADAISVVPHWRHIAKVAKPKTTYLAKLGKWVADGIDFDPNADKCCELAEGYLVESIRRDQHEDFIDPRNVKHVKPQSAVIFTVGGIAVAYKKSVGIDTTYGLRDSKDHNIAAEVFATHTFKDARIERLGRRVLTYELTEGQTFEPIRPSVTSFDLAERELFANQRLLTPLVYTALTLSHETTVGYIDDILRAHNAARGHKPA